MAIAGFGEPPFTHNCPSGLSPYGPRLSRIVAMGRYRCISLSGNDRKPYLSWNCFARWSIASTSTGCGLPPRPERRRPDQIASILRDFQADPDSGLNINQACRKAGTWFDDPEIYGWFSENLHRARKPAIRHYVRAKALKAAGMDWMEVLAAEAGNQRERLDDELLASDEHGCTAARVKVFVEQGGVCVVTIFN